ncbi:MAG: ribonuclease E/G, partial [Acidobacteriaceae bacterium]
MAKEICISTTPHETRLAIVEDDQLTEIYYERENEYTLAGSIYKGRVTRVLPGMQSAFVDVGLERDAFLYVTDFLEEQEDSADFEQVKQNGGGRGERGREGRPEARPDARQSQEAGQSQEARKPREGREPREARRPVTVEPVQAAPEAAPPSQEEFEQGTRRWRGRRRRGRGVRSRETTPQPGAQAQAATYDATQQPTFEEEQEARVTGRDSEVQGTPQPRASRHSIDASEAAPGTQANRSSGRTEARTEPAFVLPGESLQKYGHETRERAEPRESQSPQAAREASNAPAVTSRPSTLVEQPIAWDGVSVALPGETLSRHRDRSSSESVAAPNFEPQAPSPAVEEEPEQSSLQAEVSPAGHDRPQHAWTEHAPTEHAPESLTAEPGTAEAAAPEPYVPTVSDESTAGAVASNTSGIDYAFPPAHPEAAVEEHRNEASATSAEEEPEFDPHHASASYRVDPSSPSEFRFTPEITEEIPDTERISGHTNEHISGQTSEPVQQHAPEHVAHMHDEAATAAPVTESTEYHDASEHPEGSGNEATETAGSAVHHDAIHHDVAHHDVELATGHEPGDEDEHAPDHEMELPPAAQESHSIDQVHAFTPGEGPLEEELIDEDEYDFSPVYGADDDHDFEDLEEETLDSQVQGAEIGEMIREAQVDRQVHVHDAEGDHEFEESEADAGESSYGASDEFEDQQGQQDETDESEEGEGEQEPADAVATDAAQPQRRESRGGERGGDRQRGRGRQGRNGRSGGGRRQSAQTSDLPIISELLKQGQEILVQIAKEPIAKKGARITSHIALPGRFLVFMPTVNHTGVSRKIESDGERRRLKEILLSEKGEASGGFIVRTAASGASEEELRSDLRFLLNLWADIKQRSESSKSPALIYHDLNLVERILRDQVTDNFSAIWVDTETEYERVLRFLQRFQPSLIRRVKLYTKEVPLFEQFGITEEINKALRSKVWLKSGGSIVIN